MDRNTILGGVLIVSGLIGYIVGIYIEYFGRGFSVTAIMIGLASVVISKQYRLKGTP